MKHALKSIVLALVVVVLALGIRAGAALYQRQMRGIGTTLSALQKENASLKDSLAELQKQLSMLDNKVGTVSSDAAKNAASLAEIASRSQETQVDSAAAAAARVLPAVVSVAIYKDVPRIEVTYENPFGNDSFFQDIQVPVYRQSGTKNEKVGAASGFFLTSDGYILTNKHVVSDTSASYRVILAKGAEKPARVVFRDPSNDVAIIKVDGSGYPTAILGDSSMLEPGESVIAIGNALGRYGNSISAGIISGLGRTIEADDQSGTMAETLSGVIQTDAAINPGNSGGPLITLDGKVVGINVATVQGSSNVSFSIPINTVKGIIRSVTGRQER